MFFFVVVIYQRAEAIYFFRKFFYGDFQEDSVHFRKLVEKHRVRCVFGVKYKYLFI